MKKKIDTNNEEEIKSSYLYLFEKIMRDKRADLSQFVLSFREQLLKEDKIESFGELIALDLLYFHSVNNALEPWKGRDAVNEAFKLLETRKDTFTKEELRISYLKVAEAFDYLEDIEKDRQCYDEASYYAFQTMAKEDALSAKEKEIRLVWRYPEDQRKGLFPTYESLIMMFGLETGKKLFDLEKEEPEMVHDPIESNPLFPKIIDRVNIALKEYFDAHMSEFTLENYNIKKRQLLLKEGIDWTAPYENKKEVNK